jgi:predicted O-linked N-acetylglucosamine transferase (SPINDLY family)
MAINRQQRRAEKTGKKAGNSAPGAIAEIFAQAVGRQQAGALQEAVVLYERGLSHNPNVPEALSNLGLALRALGRPDAAVLRYEQALAIRPAIPEVLSNLGLALRDLGRRGEAIARYREALALRPNYPEALSNLGNALSEQGQSQEAVSCLQKALALRPKYPVALSNLGKALRDCGKLDQAIVSYRQALALQPDFPEVLFNLAVALADQGRVDEAIDRYEQAIALKPDYPEAHSNLLMALHYSERSATTSTLARAQRFARQVEPPNRRVAFANTPQPGRRLRIGYVSPDFRAHPVGYFLERFLAAHDHATVEVLCYSNSDLTDRVTERLRGSVDHWRSIVGLSDVAADMLIRRDNIDILVDLSGHTGQNRLPLFALKPAPVQASGLGYVDTTGLKAMDYVLADRFVVPVGDEASYSEKVLVLPDSYFCIAPPDIDVPIAERAPGPLTLGCFNNWMKVTPGTIALWARILGALPDSRLFLKTHYLSDPQAQSDVLKQFSDVGVGPERLILEGHEPRAQLLAAYNRVDIALDPFPFNGATTTVEALWMGVPVVTMLGHRWADRACASILTTVGVPELIADDPESYVHKVVALAQDRSHLGDLRGRLRPMLEGSPLCDGARFARAVEAFYRDMWASWCSTRAPEEGGQDINGPSM